MGCGFRILVIVVTGRGGAVMDGRTWTGVVFGILVNSELSSVFKNSYEIDIPCRINIKGALIVNLYVCVPLSGIVLWMYI